MWAAIGKNALVMFSKNQLLTGLLSVVAFSLLTAATAEPEAAKLPAAATGDAQTATVAPADAKPKKRHEENGIVALVNDIPITTYELRQRMNLVMVTSGMQKPTPEIEKKVREQVLEQLETETLQRQEAIKNDISVSSVEVDKYLQNILDENRMTKEQFQEVLSRGNVQLATFRSQLSSQILWQKAVQERYAGRVQISPEAVDAEMARIKESAHKAHFAVLEIFLAVDNPDQDDKIKKKAEDLETQIKGGASFPQLARQFSQSPSAAQGGDIGVVYDGQLAPELNAALASMKTGDMSPPIRSIGGYYILVLRQRYEPAGTKLEDDKPETVGLPATVPLGRLLLRLPPKPTADYMEKVMQIAHQIQSAVAQAPQSCEFAAKVPSQAPGVLYLPLGQTRVADLNDQARAALEKTELGGVAAPFRSDAGIEIFVRCETKVAKKVSFPVPTREQIENQMFSEQISALARRYQRDLKRSANIETR